MRNSTVAIALIATLAVGVLIGRMGGSSILGEKEGQATGADRLSNSRQRVSERRQDTPAPALTAQQRFREEIRKAPSDKLPDLVFRALELGDPLERRQLLLEIFARMDAGNFEEMIRESERSSLETSRNNYDEWAMMLVRSGQVAGQAAMEVWSADPKNNWDQLAKTMQGWASADPDAAMRWYREQEFQPNTRTNMIGAMIAGALSKDRAHAMAMLASLPEEERLNSIQQITFHLVQNQGKEGAIDWMKTVNSATPGTPYANKVADAVLDKVVWAGSNLNSIPTVVSDLERYSSAMPVDDNRLARAIMQVRSRGAVRGIELLEQLTTSSLLQSKPPSQMLLDQAVGHAVKNDRAGTEKWLQTNAASPLAQQVRQYLDAQPPPLPAGDR